VAVAIAYGTWAWAIPANTDEAELITPGAGVEYVGELAVCNQSAVDRTYRVALSDNGTGVAASTKHFIRYDTPLLANLSHVMAINIDSSISVRVRSGTASAVSFVFSGMRKTTI